MRARFAPLLPICWSPLSCLLTVASDPSGGAAQTQAAASPSLDLFLPLLPSGSLSLSRWPADGRPQGGGRPRARRSVAGCPPPLPLSLSRHVCVGVAGQGSKTPPRDASARKKGLRPFSVFFLLVLSTDKNTNPLYHKANFSTSKS